MKTRAVVALDFLNRRRFEVGFVVSRVLGVAVVFGPVRICFFGLSTQAKQSAQRN
jgi:hypothetical protein